MPIAQPAPDPRPLPVAVSAKTGDHSYQVVATEGAIIYIGPDGHLLANTGDTDSSGVVALGVGNSTLTSGDSRRQPPPPPPTQPPAAPSQTPTGGATHGNDSFLSMLGAKRNGRGTAISGFEDHSVSVIGNDQVVTYDDSNVFLARNGPINANTGDTDSSGLNAVDVVGSRVRSGNSGDGEGDGEDKDEDEESEALPKGPGSDVQHSPQPAPTGRGNGRDDDDDSDQHGLPVTLAQFPTEPRRPRGLDVIGPLIRLGNLAGALAGQEQVGEGEEDDKDEKEDGLDGADARRPGDTSATVTDEGASIASGSDSFVVGADGYDDVSIRSRGDRNIVTYDDSNLVIGGEGKVNAQIGDSDTGGAVVMGIVDSDVQAGCEGDLCYSDGPSPDRKRAGTEWPIPNAGRDHHSRTEWPLSNSSRDRRSRQMR